LFAHTHTSSLLKAVAGSQHFSRLKHCIHYYLQEKKNPKNGELYSHIIQSPYTRAHTYDYVTSHTYDYVTSHTYDYVTAHTYDYVTSHTYDYVMSHT